MTRLIRHLPTIAGAALGILFVGVGLMVLLGLGLMVLLGLGPAPQLPAEGTPPAHFFAAFGPTGYLTFVKVCEVLGGLLVAFPRTRNLGLLVLGPVIINILSFHAFVAGGTGLFDPMVIVVCLLAGYLLWVERTAFLGLLWRPLPNTDAVNPGRTKKAQQDIDLATPGS